MRQDDMGRMESARRTHDGWGSELKGSRAAHPPASSSTSSCTRVAHVCSAGMECGGGEEQQSTVIQQRKSGG